MAGAATDAPERPAEEEEYRLSICSKLCYAIGGAPNQVAGSAAAFFLQIYLLDIAHGNFFAKKAELSFLKVLCFQSVAFWCRSRPVKTKQLLRFMPLWYCSLAKPQVQLLILLLAFLLAKVDGQKLAGSCLGKHKCDAGMYTLHSSVLFFYVVPASFCIGKSCVVPDFLLPFPSTDHRMTMEVLGTLIGAALQGQIVASAHVSHHCIVNPPVNATDSWHDTPSLPDPSDPLSHQVSAAVSIPFWQKFLQRFGKKCAACGISWMIPFAVMLVTIPNLILAYFVAFVSGLSIAASLLLPWSMLPDVVDNFRLQNPHGKGQETIFYSSYVFFTKMSAGIGLGISAAGLEFTGYKPGICRQSNDVILTLKILIGAVPAILILVGLFILLFYPITEESRKETKLALEVLRRSHQSTENLDDHKEGISVWQL
ncbi:sphingosine-1-phosphate transporter MFSD2B isoform 9-T10 [Theristicus caerulescens]